MMMNKLRPQDEQKKNRIREAILFGFSTFGTFLLLVVVVVGVVATNLQRGCTAVQNSDKKRQRKLIRRTAANGKDDMITVNDKTKNCEHTNIINDDDDDDSDGASAGHILLTKQ